MTNKGEKISDEQIKEWLCELVCGDGYPYGYNKLTVCLKEDYNLLINRKKVYRLCKELNIYCSIIDYHLGLSSTACDAVRVVKNSLAKTPCIPSDSLVFYA